MKKRVCPVCGSLYELTKYYRKFCSTYCQKRSWQLDHPKPKKPKAFKPQPGPVFLQRYCQTCGEPLFGSDGRSLKKKFCCAACKQADYAFRKAGGKVIDLAQLPGLR